MPVGGTAVPLKAAKYTPGSLKTISPVFAVCERAVPFSSVLSENIMGLPAVIVGVVSA